MKKILALTLAVVFTLMLLASCADKTPTPTAAPGNSDAPAATATPAPGKTDAPTTPTDEPTPEGPFPVDERGIATEPYNYPLPITTSDDVITYWWSTYSPQYLPTDKDYQDTELPMEVRNRTGINVEYVNVPTQSRVEDFGVRLASDDLCDIMSYATAYYPGNPSQMVEDGYFANILEHAEWMPNYLYQATYKDPTDKDTHESVFYTEDLVPVAWMLWSSSIVYDSGWCVRQDFLDKVGMTADEIVTWDDLEETLRLIKTSIDSVEFPMWMNSMIEINNYWQFNSFDNISVVTTIALPPIFHKDGKVMMGCTTEGDKALVTKFNEFFNAGLINADWQSYAFGMGFTQHTYNNETFYQSLGAAQIIDTKRLTSDPDCNWVAAQKPLITPDQVIHAGTIRSRTATGNAGFATKNNNLELAMKWVDYRYSPEGWELFNYGPEGLLSEIGDDGVRRNTEWALSSPNGINLGGLMSVYTIGQLVEPGMISTDRALLNPDAAIARGASETWTSWLKVHYDAAGALPIGVRLDTEQSQTVASLRADMITYIAESFSGFISGTAPLSEWDNYINTLNQMGLQEILDIYQDAYDTYMARQG